ncbi:hypothetical protein T440DRAFT_455522 [Plenodomus tracheiphilus IPT5]|uniref:CFEM domain-containing protein n=1 Tax=Plenodomus tracheiphilus IPT5 TaxID=1408161 RepID=A0A6A7B0B5_9PLEO|nr:hypothetical protein T440DRAFT_455522 [Plenodomus tracheiphilus IPT5]
MRFLALALPLLASLPTSFAQQDSGLLAIVNQLPNCALSCLVQEVTKSSCQLTDSACLCANAELQSSIEVCVAQACTVREGLTTKNVTSTACGAPIRYNGETTRLSNIALSFLTAVLILVRMLYQALFSSWDFGWDDYTVLAGWLSGIPSVIIIDKGALPSGLGRDIWTLPFSHITNFVRWLYVLEVLYVVQITLLKLTLLMFFLRIFPKTGTRRVIWVTIAFTVTWGVTFAIAAIFQCRPISYFWTSWDQVSSGKCIDINALGWSQAAINIALDIWMLALPLYVVCHLQMTWRKKASVAVMFSVGTFVTIVSVLRLQSLVHFAVSTNPTMDQRDIIHWSNIEVNVALVCACLPNLRLILGRFLPKVMGMSSKSGNKQMYSSYGPRSERGTKGEMDSANKDLESGVKTPRDSDTITYSKTFEVQHTDNDEIPLVEMTRFTFGDRKGPNSSASVVSG